MMDDLFYVERIRAGEDEAFRFLIRKYQDYSFSIAISVLKDDFMAQEVVQDAFVKVYRNLHSFQGKSSFSTWLFRIVTNEALMRLRKTKQDRLEFYDSFTDEDVPVQLELPAMQDEEWERLLNRALQELSPNESLAIRLFYLEEENVKKVREITGWTDTNTKTILHRARKNLKRVLLALLKKEEHG